MFALNICLAMMNQINDKDCVLQPGMKLKEPIKVNSKGCSKIVKHDGAKNRKCSKCFQLGHTKRTCPLYSPKDMQPSDLHCSVGGIGCVSTNDQQLVLIMC